MRINSTPHCVPRVAAEVVVAAIAGDRDAFAEIYRVYYPIVDRYVAYRARGWSVSHREDLTSEVFTRAWSRISGYEHTGRDIGAWLVTIARNLLADTFKSSAYRRRSSLRLEDCDDTVEDTPTCQAAIDSAHLRQVLRDAVDGLSQTQRAVIVLRFWADLSIADTAARLGLDEGAVKGRQTRACRALAQHQEVAALTRPE